MFRRDRLTGQVAIGLVGVLAVAAVVYGVGVASAKYNLSDIGAWLSASKRGVVVHANGLAGKVDGKANLIKGMRGHRIKVVQDGTNVLLVDEDTGIVSRLDPSQLKVDQSRPFAVGVQVVVGAGAAYTLDSIKGTVQQIDPVSLAAVGPPAALTPQLGQAGIDAKGRLWVPLPQTGQAMPFHGGRQLTPVQVGKPGDALGLTIAAGVPVITNSTEATAHIIRPEGATKITLPSAVSQAGRGGVKVPLVIESQVVPMLGQAGSLVLLNTATNGLTSVGLRMARHDFGVPHTLGARVYIPDQTAGALVVYNSSTNRFEPQLRVSGKPGVLEVFVKDGLLWANDPSGENAVSIDANGAVKPIQKYEPAVPGSARRPLPNNPAPPGGGNGGDNPRGPKPPKPGRPNPGKTGKPKPAEPTAPSIDQTREGDGFVEVTFSAPREGQPERYGLEVTPAAGQITPPSIQPGGELKFTATIARDCNTYGFRVIAFFKGGKEKKSRAVGAKPCIVPGQPQNVRSASGMGFVEVTFEPPSKGGQPDWYVLKGAPQGATVTPLKVSGNEPRSFRVSIAGPCVNLADLQVVAVNKLNEIPADVPDALSCVAPSQPGNFSAKGRNHGASLTWDPPPGGSLLKYTLEWTGATSGSKQVTGESADVDGLTNGGTYTFTITPETAGGTGARAQANADLSYKQQSIRNANNNQTNTIIRPQPSKTGEIGKILKGQYLNITVICQIQGASVTEEETNETSTWWNRIVWNGQTGYLSVTLMEGPRSPNDSLYEC